MKRVFSSHIDQIGYDAQTQTLRVVYTSGRQAAYGNVPPDVAKRVVDAPSIGGALHAEIRGKFAHSYLSGDEE